MKILLTLFVLLFSSSVVADDISDFQIEGISIGDSLLDYMSEDEIKKNITDIYSYIDEKKFIISGFIPKNSSSNYGLIQITFKINDNKYIVHGIGGNINPISTSECFSKQKEAEKNISNIFKNFEKFGPVTGKHPVDKTGKSTVKQISYNLNSGAVALIECYDFSEQVSYLDSFAISIYSKELNEWLQKYQ